MISHVKMGNWIKHKVIQSPLYKNEINNNNHVGISVWGNFNFIIGNNIENHNEYGIKLFQCSFTLIKKNNFIENDCNAYFENSGFNRWVRNYWDDRIGFRPKIIEGFILIPSYHDYGEGEKYPWQNFDWRPRIIPYNIGTAQGCDID